MLNEIYKSAFLHIEDGMFIHDEDLNIIDINPAAEKITGYSKKYVIGKQCKKIFKGSLCDQECAICRNINDGRKKENYETEFVRKDGSSYMIRLNSHPFIGNNGSKNYFLVVMQDMTELAQLREKFNEAKSFHNIVGKNEKMREIYRLVQNVAETDSTVLITGETGAGKELIASAIHYCSDRSRGAFIRINCAALPENLLESELFGHVKGAFTGATRDRRGRFESASGGTIFLDEVGDTSLAFQSKLLRVLQEREIERVGDNRTRKINVRVLAATNKNLFSLIKQNKFREDLYFRLAVVNIDLPPLRERQDDIPLLADHILSELNIKSKKKVKSFSSEVMKILTSYPWPGNIRELKNSIESAIIFCRKDIIRKENLPASLRSLEISEELPDNVDMSQFPEQERIRKTLHLCRWNVKAAAKKLNISRTTLWRKMKKFEIH